MLELAGVPLFALHKKILPAFTCANFGKFYRSITAGFPVLPGCCDTAMFVKEAA